MEKGSKKLALKMLSHGLIQIFLLAVPIAIGIADNQKDDKMIFVKKVHF